MPPMRVNQITLQSAPIIPRPHPRLRLRPQHLTTMLATSHTLHLLVQHKKARAHRTDAILITIS